MPAKQSLNLRIVHAASERRAREFSVRLARELPALFEAELVDIKSLDPGSGFWWQRYGAIYVLSPSALASEKVRALLVKTARFVGSTTPQFLYYICVDCKRSTVLRKYPDLAGFFELALVNEEKDKLALVAELNKFRIEDRSLLRSGVSLIKFFGLIPGLILAAAELLRMALWPGLMLPWIFWGNRTGEFPVLGVAWLCIIDAGSLITRMPACDFWPWLGCRSRASKQRLSHQEFHTPIDTGIFWFLLRTWTSGSAWSSRSVIAGDDCRTCSPRELYEAEIGWKISLNIRRVVTSIFLLYLTGLPAYVITRLNAGNAGLIALAFAGGALIPLLHMVTYRATRLYRQARRGLSANRLDTAQRLRERIWRADRRLSFGGKTINPRGLMHHDWLLKGCLNFVWCRDMFPQPPFVFLSYSRADDAKSGHVTAVADSLSRLGIPYYLDREVQSMSTWRKEAALSLHKATHVIAFAGPGALASQAVQRELRASLQRSPNELPPAIICVTDCDLSRRLLETSDLTVEWEFVLTWCALLLPDELSEPEKLGLLIRQRMRQGLLKDWGTYLGLGPSPLSTTRALIQSNEGAQV